jgi:hypothetical protein
MTTNAIFIWIWVRARQILTTHPPVVNGRIAQHGRIAHMDESPDAMVGVAACAPHRRPKCSRAQWDGRRTTYFTFSKAVQIPGVSLAAGNVHLRGGRAVQQVGHRSRFEARSIARLSDRVYESGPRIKAWYPEGERTGREFLY